MFPGGWQSRADRTPPSRGSPSPGPHYPLRVEARTHRCIRTNTTRVATRITTAQPHAPCPAPGAHRLRALRAFHPSTPTIVQCTMHVVRCNRSSCLHGAAHIGKAGPPTHTPRMAHPRHGGGGGGMQGNPNRGSFLGRPPPVPTGAGRWEEWEWALLAHPRRNARSELPSSPQLATPACATCGRRVRTYGTLRYVS